jgi:hypothetical protein
MFTSIHPKYPLNCKSLTSSVFGLYKYLKLKPKPYFLLYSLTHLTFDTTGILLVFAICLAITCLAALYVKIRKNKYIYTHYVLVINIFSVQNLKSFWCFSPQTDQINIVLRLLSRHRQNSSLSYLRNCLGIEKLKRI